MGGRHAATTQGFHWKEGVLLAVAHPFSQKERKKTDNPREGWEDGTSPPHRDFKERSAVLAVAHPCASTFSYLCSQFLANSRSDLHATFFATLFLLRKEFAAKILFLESFGGFGKGVGEILWKAADVRQNKLTRAQYLDEVTWTTKNGLGLQKQRISVVLHTAIAEQVVNELACGEGGRVHGAKCLTVLAGVA